MPREGLHKSFPCFFAAIELAAQAHESDFQGWGREPIFSRRKVAAKRTQRLGQNSCCEFLPSPTESLVVVAEKFSFTTRQEKQAAS
jgi:hypothetical protein